MLMTRAMAYILWLNHAAPFKTAATMGQNGIHGFLHLFPSNQLFSKGRFG